MERAVLSAKDEILRVTPPAIRVESPVNGKVLETGSGMPAHGELPLATLKENERDHIRRALQHTGGRISGPQGAAAILGLPPSTLRSLIKKVKL